MGTWRRRGSARPCSRPRWKLASGTIRPSSSWSGPVRKAGRRSSPRCSRPRGRPEPAPLPLGLPMSFDLDGPLLLVGAGKMGGALLSGWLARGLDPAHVIVMDPAPPPEVKHLLDQHRIRLEPALPRLAKPPAAILMAVKPQ